VNSDKKQIIMMKKEISSPDWCRNKRRKWHQNFQDSDGLWEGHNVQDVATPEGW
jgi:hypothetical protein